MLQYLRSCIARIDYFSQQYVSDEEVENCKVSIVVDTQLDQVGM